MVACANGDRDTAVVYLLRKGADPNAANAAQRRAVDFARQNNRFSTVQLLELATEATHQRELRKWRESTGAARRALPSCCSARPRSKGSSAAGWQRQAGADLSFANIR
jgi:ankyrin repeat protein